MASSDTIKLFKSCTSEFERNVLFGDGRSFETDLDSIWFPDSRGFIRDKDLKEAKELREMINGDN